MANLKILLVDDSEIMLKHLTGLLKPRGHEIIPTKNLVEAVAAYAQNAPQAILADFVLEGGQTGIEVVSAIFSLCTQGVRPLAAILTLGVLSEADLARAAKMGLPVFQKPKLGTEQDFVMDIELWLRAAMRA